MCLFTLMICVRIKNVKEKSLCIVLVVYTALKEIHRFAVKITSDIVI